MLNKNYGKPTLSSGIQYAPRQFVENGAVFVPRVDGVLVDFCNKHNITVGDKLFNVNENLF